MSKVLQSKFALWLDPMFLEWFGLPSSPCDRKDSRVLKNRVVSYSCGATSAVVGAVLVQNGRERCKSKGNARSVSTRQSDSFLDSLKIRPRSQNRKTSEKTETTFLEWYVLHRIVRYGTAPRRITTQLTCTTYSIIAVIVHIVVEAFHFLVLLHLLHMKIA